MPTTLLRGITGASRRASSSATRWPVNWIGVYSGSPGTTAISLPSTTPNRGASPVGNLAVSTAGAQRAGCGKLTDVDTVLAREEWARRESEHQARVDAFLAGHLDRGRRDERHPVEDFLFTYYSLRPAQLRRWHPGAGTALMDAAERAGWR